MLRAREEVLPGHSPPWTPSSPGTTAPGTRTRLRTWVQQALRDQHLLPDETAIIKDAHMVVSGVSGDTGLRYAVVHAPVNASNQAVITVRNPAALMVR